MPRRRTGLRSLHPARPIPTVRPHSLRASPPTPWCRLLPLPAKGGSYSAVNLTFSTASRAIRWTSGVRSFRSSTVMPCRSKGAGLVGMGCVGAVHSPGTSDLGTAVSSIGQMGSPVLTIENVCERLFGELRHDFTRLSVHDDVGQDGVRRDIEVPDVMVDDLVVPDSLTSRRIQRHQRRREQIQARAVTPIRVAGTGLDRGRRRIPTPDLPTWAPRRPHCPKTRPSRRAKCRYPNSPSVGTVWNDQSSSPVRASNARTSPGTLAWEGHAEAYLEGRPHDHGIADHQGWRAVPDRSGDGPVASASADPSHMSTTPSSPNPVTGWAGGRVQSYQPETWRHSEISAGRPPTPNSRAPVRNSAGALLPNARHRSCATSTTSRPTPGSIATTDRREPAVA